MAAPRCDGCDHEWGIHLSNNKGCGFGGEGGCDCPGWAEPGTLSTIGEVLYDWDGRFTD